jgi:hypothetical protein
MELQTLPRYFLPYVSFSVTVRPDLTLRSMAVTRSVYLTKNETYKIEELKYFHDDEDRRIKMS